MSSDDLPKKALTYFHDGYNCAQSVLLTMAEHWGIRSKLVPKVATAFGSGIGRCGSLCGALTGGVMALSAKFGTNEPSPRKREKAYSLAQKLYRCFEEHFGTVLCRELLGYDLSVPEEIETARREGLFDKKCTVFIREVIDFLNAIT